MESTLVSTQAFEFIPFLKNISVGLVGLFISLYINVFCLRRIAIVYEIKARVCMNKNDPNGVFFHYFLAINNLMLVQILAITTWGGILKVFSLIDDPLGAIIFAGSCYTTIGIVSDVMPPGWHFMSILIALSGLFAVALATASMLNMTVLFRRAWLLKHADKLQEIISRENIEIPDFVSLEETIKVRAKITTQGNTNPPGNKPS